MVPGYNDHTHPRDCHWKSGVGEEQGESGGRWVGLNAKDFLKEHFKPNAYFQWGGVG